MRNTSVLNTDSFDNRRFKEISNMSMKMKELNDQGKSHLPTFPDLLGDIWASLYKVKPEIREKVSEGLETNRTLMQNIMNDKSFQTFREVSRLDALTSAVGTVNFGEKTSEWLLEQEQRNEELHRLMDEARRQQEKLQQQIDKTGQNDKDQPKNGEQSAERKQAQQALEQALQQTAQALQSNTTGFSQTMAEAVRETRQTKENMKSLLSGTKAGSGEAEMKKMPLRDQIALAEKLSENKKLKEIAQWAGRFKQIARKKQKSKHEDSVERSGVTIGNQVERLMPMELAQYASPVTKTDFLRRFAEGETLQYQQKGKESLGKGPIILCLDQSGSMSDLDTQSKGFTLALMSIARRQKRDFTLILFSTQAITLEYESGKITPNDMAELATTFLGGGTKFDRPLESALNVIEKSRYKKADIVFVTDGEDNFLKPSVIERVNHKKREKEFSILSILLGTEYKETVRRFADKIVKAEDLTDEASQTAFKI